MSDMSASSPCCNPTYVNPNYEPSCTYRGSEPSAPVSGEDLIDEYRDLAQRFGEDGVITAYEAKILKYVAESMKEQIANDPNMPPGMKDELIRYLDHEVAKAEAAVPPGCGEAVEQSPCGEALETWNKLFMEGLEIAREQGLCPEKALEFALDYAREGMEHAYPPGDGGGVPDGGGDDGAPDCGGGAPEGGRSDYASLYAEGLEVARSEGLSGEAARDRAEEYAEEAINEGRTTRGGTDTTEGGGGGGGGGTSGTDASGDEPIDLVENFRQSSARQHEENEDAQRGGGGTGGKGGGGTGGAGGSGNWLIALAKGMAEVQDKFLTTAMEAMETMKKTAGYEELEGQAKTDMKTEFLDAQATYQASIQMFTMMANITATSIKSIGEGCSTVLRKQ